MRTEEAGGGAGLVSPVEGEDPMDQGFRTMHDLLVHAKQEEKKLKSRLS